MVTAGRSPLECDQDPSSLWHGSDAAANLESTTARSHAGVDSIRLLRQPTREIDGGSLTYLGALAELIRIEDGWFTPPDRPGHGIVFDRAVLAAHAVDA
jgi:L-alanine-DL-glutamate epimerase-like enolase superfamily enzyme